MTNHDSYYHELHNEPVIVCSRGLNFIGILEYDGHDVLKLRPCIVHEPVLRHSGNFEMKSLPYYRLETKRPSIINTMDVTGVQPTTQSHIDDLIKFSKEQNEK
jgi:hypothetical protein